MTTQTWLANTTGKTEASAGTAVTLRAAQSGSSKKLTVNSGLISFLQNSSALTMSGYSLTGSQATSLLDMTGVWNTSGTPTALKLNVTDTNSNASSALLDLQVGGVSQFKVSKAGAVTAVGVAIPTISSTSTLTNKTLSSPTISGTVTLSGNVTFSGQSIFSGANPIIPAVGADQGLQAQSGAVVIFALTREGSGVKLETIADVEFWTGNDGVAPGTGTKRAFIPSAGGMVVGTAAIATNATDGFMYVPTCAGTPTGTPTTQTGAAPIVVDTTNHKLYFYSGGSWRDAGP